MSPEAVERVRGLAARLAVTFGILFWYVAANAEKLVEWAQLPLLALGCALYLFPGRALFTRVHHELRGHPFRPSPQRIRWWNFADAAAVIGIAAWINMSVHWILVLPLLIAAWFPIQGETRAESRAKEFAAGILLDARRWFQRSPRRRGMLDWLAFQAVTVAMIAVPIVLAILALIVGVFRQDPSYFPLAAANAAWCLIFPFGLVAFRAFLLWLGEKPARHDVHNRRARWGRS